VVFIELLGASKRGQKETNLRKVSKLQECGNTAEHAAF
jgi:hypothetical protein